LFPSTKEISTELIINNFAQKFPYAAHWIQFRIFDQESAQHAIWLFKLHCDRLLGVDSNKLLQAITDHKLK